MESSRNVLLEFVYREANTQIQGLGAGIRGNYNINEVVAYTLNRLPAKFASTDEALAIKKQECMEIQADITKHVRQSLIAVRRDPLRQHQPLEEVDLANAPYSLLNAQKLLGWDCLMWADLPKALEDALEEAIAKYNSGSGSPVTTKYGALGRSRMQSQMYLTKQAPKRSVANELRQAEHDIYMLESNQLVHSLERLVVKMAQNRAQNFQPAELKFIRLEDVLAKSLNRLPPLYATSAKGLGHLRHYAQMNIGSEVSIIVYESMLETRNENMQRIDNLMFYQFRREREQAIAKVSKLLFNREVTWQNLNDVLSECLDMAKSGKVCWERPVKANV